MTKDGSERATKRFHNMEESDAGSTGWAQLDRDTLAAIVGFLEPREVAALACSCREARSVARDNAVWAPLLASHFGLNLEAPDHTNLFAVFRTLYDAFKSGSAGAGAMVGAIALEGLYTDGGMDMGDPAFWAGNIFQPNGWSIYCSHAPSNVHCIAQLKAVRSEDPVSAAYRSEIISLASDVAWLLFLSRMPARQLRRQLAAAAAPSRSSASGALMGPAAARRRGRANIAGGGGGGRCSSNPGRAQAQAQVTALVARLRGAMKCSLSRWSNEGLKHLMIQLLIHYKVLQVQLEQQQQQQQQQRAAQERGSEGSGGGVPAGVAAAPVAALPPHIPAPGDVGMDWIGIVAPGVLLQPPLVSTVGVPLQPRLTAVARDLVLGRTLSGRRALVGLGAPDRVLGAAAAPGPPGSPAGTGEGGALQVWSRQSREYLCSPALESTTAIVDALTVSRTGEFTCPVACGAVFMAQRSRAAGLRESAADGAGSGRGGGGGVTPIQEDNGTGRQQRVGPEDEEEQGKAQERVRREFVGMVRQPYVQALSDMTSLAAVEAAAEAGVLPPIVARGSCRGEGEWTEFQRPRSAPAAAAALYGRLAASCSPAAAGGPCGSGGAEADDAAAEYGDAASGGGVLWPVVWFRFFRHDGLGDEADQNMALPPLLAPLLPPQPQQQQQQQQQQQPGLDLNVDLDLDLPLPPAPDSDVSEGVADQDKATGDGNGGSSDDGRVPYSDDGGASGEGGRSSAPSGDAGSRMNGEDEDVEQEDDGANEADDDQEEELEDVVNMFDGGSSASSEADDEDDEEDGADGWHLEDTNTEEWENELDFLYGIEGMPYSFNATAGQNLSDSDDELAEPVHPYTDGGADGAGPGPSSRAASAAAAAAASNGAGRQPRRKSDLHLYQRDPQGPGDGESKSRSRNRQTQQPTAYGGGGGGVGGRDGGGAKGAGPSTPPPPAVPEYNAGELLQGVPMLAWLNHLTRPQVAGAALGLVADAAGVQAIRHTFQNIMTVLQPSAAAMASPRAPAPLALAAAPAQGAAGWAAAAATPAAAQAAGAGAGATAAGGAATAQPSAAARGGTTAGATAAATAAPADSPVVLLPPEPTAELAFDGLPDAPPLLPPPQLTASSAPSDASGQSPYRHHSQPPASAAAPAPAATAAPELLADTAAAASRPPSGHLVMSLCQRWVGNTVLLKLIAPEDRTAVFGDEADTPLNIDVQFVALRGVTLALRPPLRMPADC